MRKKLLSLIAIVSILNMGGYCLAEEVGSNANRTVVTAEKTIKLNNEKDSFVKEDGTLMISVKRVFDEIGIAVIKDGNTKRRVAGFLDGKMYEVYSDGRFFIGNTSGDRMVGTMSKNDIIYAPADKLMENLQYNIEVGTNSIKISKVNPLTKAYKRLEALSYRGLSKEEKQEEVILISKLMDGENYNRLSQDKLQQLKNADLETVKKEISTIYDFVTFLKVKGFSGVSGEQRIKDKTNYYDYRFNLKAEEVFKNNKGNCGAIANLARYILEDDYQEIGYLHTSRPDRSGHVINYFFKDNFYYLIDFTDFTMDSKEGMFRGRFLTMEESLDRYAKNDILVFYYSNYEHQIPSASRMKYNNNIRYLPEECKEGIMILKEEDLTIEFISTFPKEIIPDKIVKNEVGSIDNKPYEIGAYRRKINI